MDIDNKTLWNDYRMAQPLNDRVVESSFLPRLGKGSMCCNTVMTHHSNVIFSSELLRNTAVLWV